MTVPQLIRTTRASLRAASEPAFRKGVRNFFQEPVDPYGVRTKEVQRIVRDIYREVKTWPQQRRDQFANALWKSGKLEEGVLVCHLYGRFVSDFGVREFGMFETWIDRYVRNWAHTDGVGTWLIAGAIANQPALIRRLDAWTKSKKRWKRRAAIVSLLQEAKRGRNTSSVFRIARRLLLDPDPIVQKGVGWVLKEAYPPKPRDVCKFLDPWRAKAPRLLLRIAAEKMSARDKLWLLKG